MSDSSAQFRISLLFLLFYCLAWPAMAQDKPAPAPTAIPLAGPPARLTATLVPPSAAVGETVTLTLAYTLPPGCGLPTPPAIDGLEGLTIFDPQTTTDSLALRFIVDSLTDLNLGPIGLVCQEASGARRKIVADQLTLKVTSNLAKGTDPEPKPIFDIIPAYPVWLAWLLWTGLAVLVILAGLGLFFWYRRRAGRGSGPPPALPPHIRAQQELEELAASGLFEKGEAKAYYFKYSEILKRYLEALRGFPAAEFTTEEIGARIRTEIDRDLVALLKRADLVKFADEVPLASRRDQDMQAALAYIATTAPRPAPEPGGRP